MGLGLRRVVLQYPWRGGRFRPESVAAFNRNQWQPSPGIGGRFRPESVATFDRNTHPERRQDKGPMPKPRWRPLPALLYAQVVKQYRRKRMIGVTHRVVFGTLEAVQHVLAARGWKMNTSFVERLNLDIR